MKILVVRFSSIGDIVLTTPVLRCIKTQRPDIQVHYLTKVAFRQVVAYNPHVDKFHYLEDDFNAMVEELKKEKFDYIIDLHNNLRTMRLKRKLKAKSYSFNKLNIRKWLLVNLKINLMPDKSIVLRYLDTVKHLGIKNDGEGLEYHIPDFTKLKSGDIPMSHWAGYIGCVIGGTHNTKKLPVEKWKELLAKVNFPVILLGGPGDREEGAQIAALDNTRIYNACGKFTINESAYLVHNAKVVLTNDTGLMHMAAAYKKPVISFWGNTVPEFGMFPYYGNNNIKTIVNQQSVIVRHPKLSCQPCSKIGYEKCPKGHFKCMNELDMQQVAARVNDMLKAIK